jgi:hypothetical protein
LRTPFLFSSCLSSKNIYWWGLYNQSPSSINFQLHQIIGFSSASLFIN